MTKFRKRDIDDHVVMRAVTITGDSVFAANHEHEELPPGAWSMAYEGWTGETLWALHVAAALREEFPDLLFEPINGCILGIYPQG